MQDIRKPYTRSRSNDLQSRVEQFEAARRGSYDEEEPVRIPVKKVRRDIRDMEMYPKRLKDEVYEEDVTPYQDDEDFRIPRTRLPKKKISLSALLSVLSVFLLIIGITLYTYVFNSATITIVPKYKDVNDLSRVFTFSKEDTNGPGIPYLTETTSLSKSKVLTYSETRKVEAKASGKATIYNNYDSNPQKLIKNTRFLSTSGKIYRINQSIEIPGKVGDTPGKIDVTLYADSTGADYNSEPTSFSIPGFKGTPRETTFYAKSTGPITGGSSGTKSLVSISDLNAAKDSLILELDKEIKDEVKKIKKEGYVPLYSAVEITYEDNESDIMAGNSETYKITATGHLMLASESRLAEAVASSLVDYEKDPVRLGYVDTLVFTRKQSDKISATTTLPLLIEGKPRIIWVSDVAKIKELVSGQDRDNFKPIMKTLTSVESAEINFSPMWLSSFPSDPKKIIVEESLPKR